MRDDHQSINQQEAYPVFYPQDEISLVEIFSILRRRYLLIVFIVVLAVIAAAVYVANAQSIYESRAVFRVGSIGGTQNVSGDAPIEPPAILVKRLKEDYGVGDARERHDLPRLESVSVDKNSTELIELLARAHSADEAQDFLEKVSDKLLLEHRQLYDRAKQALGGRLDYLRNAKMAIDQALADIDANVEGLVQRDISAAVLFALEKTRLLEQSLEVEGRIAELKIVQEIKSYPSSLIRTATYSERTVAPKRPLILILTFILALIMGVILAFIVEFISLNNKNDDNKNIQAKG